MDKQVIKKRREDFHHLITKLSGHDTSPRPPSRSIKETRDLMKAFMELFEFIYSLTDEITNQSKFVQFKEGAIKIGLYNHNPNDTRTLLYLYKTYSATVDRNILFRFINVIERYGIRHGLSKDSIKSFQENLLSAMISGSRDVDILQRAGNIWGMRKGDFGIADFTCHCYLVRVTPPNLNNLLMIAKEIPTTNVARFEQNRKDALALAGTFGALRDFIHDQGKIVNEVLKAMIEYYETGNRNRLQALLPKAEGYLDSAERQEIIFNRENYEKEVEETVNGKKNKTKAINILRRLVINTAPTSEDVPLTSDEEFNGIMRQIKDNFSKDTLEKALHYINEKLIIMMRSREIGIEPSLVLALAWIERKQFLILQNLSYEEQMGTYKRGWFHSILKFQELTSSSRDYNEKEFQSFLKQVVSADYDREAYKIISKRVLMNVSELAKIYKAAGRRHIIGALWSGNVTHELIGLTDLKPASTVVGERHRKERLVPEWMRKTGD